MTGQERPCQVTTKPVYLQTCLKYPTPAIGGLFFGVSSGSGLGRASNSFQHAFRKQKSILETDEFVTDTRHFQKKHLAGAILCLKSAREALSYYFFLNLKLFFHLGNSAKNTFLSKCSC
jgi:hypothetical protein